ncbi:hypothetical protein DdX_01528 [Ditylenchus destructor]|uniref:Uncharacterized protein n=1 Tax=Ditylenchus destructor TaxID=166010 RepID=A0AAD4NGY8_9BILA|nr:hypothetical protein DdX_01528 [Ditylenchus destructor]
MFLEEHCAKVDFNERQPFPHPFDYPAYGDNRCLDRSARTAISTTRTSGKSFANCALETAKVGNFAVERALK